jgi:hypothetical protein
MSVRSRSWYLVRNEWVGECSIQASYYLGSNHGRLGVIGLGQDVVVLHVVLLCALLVRIRVIEGF